MSHVSEPNVFTNDLLWKERFAKEFPLYYSHVKTNYRSAYKLLSVVKSLKYPHAPKASFLNDINIDKELDLATFGFYVSLVHPLDKMNLVKGPDDSLYIRPKIQISFHSSICSEKPTPGFEIRYYPDRDSFGATSKSFSVPYTEIERLRVFLAKMKAKGYLRLSTGYNPDVLCIKEVLDYDELYDMVIKTY